MNEIRSFFGAKFILKRYLYRTVIIRFIALLQFDFINMRMSKKIPN